MRRRLCFLIRQLNEGGAQRQLVALARALDRTEFEVSVVTFYKGGRFESEAREIPGVTYYSLDKRGRWEIILFLARLVRIVRRIRPHVLHGYLSTANLLTVFLKPLVPGMRAVWGVRSSDMDPSRYDWLTRLHYAAERKLARFADLIVSNSQSAKAFYAARGVPQERWIVIPNGIDVARFQPRSAGQDGIRSDLGIASTDHVIAIVARLDPMKDHATFLRAANILVGAHKNVRFLCVGSGPETYRRELDALTASLGLDSTVIWAGPRTDMVDVYAEIDILTLCSSYGEGFPNVVAEAMACGVRCVVTDVGDARLIVGDTGAVIPPGDPEALANAWHHLLTAGSADQERMRRQARQLIVDRFGTDALASRTRDALLRLIGPAD